MNSRGFHDDSSSTTSRTSGREAGVGSVVEAVVAVVGAAVVVRAASIFNVTLTIYARCMSSARSPCEGIVEMAGAAPRPRLDQAASAAWPSTSCAASMQLTRQPRASRPAIRPKWNQETDSPSPIVSSRQPQARHVTGASWPARTAWAAGWSMVRSAVMAGSSAQKVVTASSAGQGRCQAESVAVWLRGVEDPAIDVGDRLIADLLVDAVRGRVGEIGEQEAEPVAGRERLVRGRGDEVARVPAAAPVGRRVDRPDPDAMRRRRA